MAVALFQRWMSHPDQADLVEAAREELRGRNLACWCAQGTPCHADVLIVIANPPKTEEERS
jgi:hypothetical protein